MEVYVDIDESGNVTVDVDHGAGPGCKKILDAFNGLGKVRKEGIKAEYYKKDDSVVSNGCNVRAGR